MAAQKKTTKTTPVKKTVKATSKRGPKAITEPKKFIIQNQADQGISYSEIIKKVNRAIKINIKSLEIYVKSAENKAYYVVNGSVTGSVDLF